MDAGVIPSFSHKSRSRSSSPPGSVVRKWERPYASEAWAWNHVLYDRTSGPLDPCLQADLARLRKRDAGVMSIQYCTYRKPEAVRTQHAEVGAASGVRCQGVKMGRWEDVGDQDSGITGVKEIELRPPNLVECKTAHARERIKNERSKTLIEEHTISIVALGGCSILSL
jgi:hypothetical protein